MLEVLGFVIKFSLYVSGLFCIGLGIHGGLGIRRLHRLLMISALVFLVSVILRLLHANALLGGNLSSAFTQETIGWVWPAYATQSYLFALAICLILLSTRIPASRLQQMLLSISALAIAIGFGQAGHAQSLDKPGAAPILVFIHTLIAGFWLVAPVTLWPLNSEDNNEIEQRTRQFSAWAVGFIPLLFVTGIWLLWRIGGNLSHILEQTYGRLLLAKLAVASIILGVGAYNKMSVTNRLIQNPAHGRTSLKKTLRLEAILFFVTIFLIAMATTFFGPNHSSL